MPTVAASSSGRALSATSLTVSHTVPAGTDRMLVVLVDCSAAMNLTATYGGTPLVVSSDVAGGFHVVVFTLANPTVGTANVVVTSVGAVAGTLAAGVVTLTGCTYVGPLTKASGTSTAPSVTVSSAVGALVLDLCVTGTASINFTVGAGQTSHVEQDGLTGTAGRIAVSSEPGAASVTMAWTLSASAAWDLFALTAYPTTPTATITRVSATPAGTTSTAPASVSVTFASAPAVGHAVIAAVLANSAGAASTTCTDTAGNAYTLAKAQADGVGQAVDVYYCPILTATATPFTVTFTGGTVNRTAIAVAYSGVGAGLTVDRSAGSTFSAATTASVGPLAALTAAEVVVVAALANNQSSGSITVHPSGWTQEFEDVASPTPGGEVDSQILPAALGTTPNAWWGLTANFSGCAALVAFASIGVTVPDVVGLTEAAAGAALVAASLVTGTVTTADSTTVAIGLVISQTPTAGSTVAPGSGVDFVVSAGDPAAPVYVVGIGETEVVPLLATFRIQETIDAPDTMIADVFTVGSPFVRFSLGAAVVVTENGVRIFGGVVTGTRERGLTGPSATDLVVEIQATSYELSAARRVITAVFSQGTPAETIGAAFASLVTNYYAEVDVTLHPDQVAGPGLPAATFTRVRGDAVNKHLASSVGYLQSIDFENRLRAWAPGDVLAPDAYDEAVNPELLTGDITVERQLQNGYANRVILTGDPIPVSDHKDSFTGDGVTDTWPVTYLVNGPYPYFVDGAVAFGVIDFPATTSTESIGGVEAPPGFLWEYDPIALTIHRRGGPVAVGVAFDFRYHGLFIPAGMAEDAGEIATYGLWEHVENVTAVITDVSAQDYADALLAAKIASKDEIVRLQTRALGFHPGQTMTIVSFSRLLAGDYLITQVDTSSESGGIQLVRSITASKSQNNTHDWRRVYQQWAGASATTSGGT